MTIWKGALLMISGWGAISLLIASVITAIKPTLYLQHLAFMIFLSPLSLRPTYCFISRVKVSTFIVYKKQRHWLHLNPFLSTGKPGVKAMSHYWRSLVTTALLSLSSSDKSVFMSSHLLSARRMAKLKRHFPAERYLFRAIERPIPKMEQVGLQIDTFLREWRWFKPATSGGIVIVRKKTTK